MNKTYLLVLLAIITFSFNAHAFFVSDTFSSGGLSSVTYTNLSVGGGTKIFIDSGTLRFNGTGGGGWPTPAYVRLKENVSAGLNGSLSFDIRAVTASSTGGVFLAVGNNFAWATTTQRNFMGLDYNPASNWFLAEQYVNYGGTTGFQRLCTNWNATLDTQWHHVEIEIRRDTNSTGAVKNTTLDLYFDHVLVCSNTQADNYAMGAQITDLTTAGAHDIRIDNLVWADEER